MISVWMHQMFVRDTGAGSSEFEFDGDGPTLLRELIEEVCGENKNLKFRILDEQRNLRPHVNVFVGSKNCRRLEGEETVVSSGEEVSIFPSLSGV